ncbi:hypothetical protein Droror1_Dr00026866, partial [Drosera rotundifolia]
MLNTLLNREFPRSPFCSKGIQANEAEASRDPDTTKPTTSCLHLTPSSSFSPFHHTDGATPPPPKSTFKSSHSNTLTLVRILYGVSKANAMVSSFVSDPAGNRDGEMEQNRLLERQKSETYA